MQICSFVNLRLNTTGAAFWRSRSTTLRLVAHAATGTTFVAPKVGKGAKIKVKTSGEPLALHAKTPEPHMRTVKVFSGRGGHWPSAKNIDFA